MFTTLPMLAGLTGLTGLALAAPPVEEDPEGVVRVELVADVDAVHPGESFHLAVRFRMERAWHIYWENPGDSGLATEVRFEAPPGFELGPTLYPVPERFTLPGEITCYGYQGEVLLLARVTAPKALPQGKLDFKASAHWLACKEACYVQSGESSLELDARAGAAETGPSRVFLKTLARLPAALPEGLVASRWRMDGDRWEATLSSDGAKRLDFFPARGIALESVEARVASDGQSAALQLLFAHDPEGRLPGLKGVVAIESAGAWKYYDLEITAQRTRH